MTQLMDLPDELLLHILHYFENDKPILCRVALVSFRLSSLVRPILINTLSSPSFLNPSSTRFDKLLQSLEQNEKLPALVRSVDMSWTQKHLDIHPKVNRFLGKLVSLRMLALNSSISSLDMHPFHPTFLDCNGLEHLSEASIKDRHLTSDILVKYIFLERIKHLKIDRFHDMALPNVPPRYKKHSSSLLSLDFGSHYPVSLELLANLLQYPHALRNLTCTIPGDASFGFMGRIKKMTSQLSPFKLSQALWDTRQSLESLVVFGNSLQWPGHDGSRLHLHDFTYLKKISIPSELMFGLSDSKASRDAVYKSLPASLEYLEVRTSLQSSPQYPFWHLNSFSDSFTLNLYLHLYFSGSVRERSVLTYFFQIIFHFGNTIVPTRPSPTSTNDSEIQDFTALTWIFELAAHKSTHTPKLTSIHLHEDTKGGRRGMKMYDAIPLAMPPSIQKALEMQKIELVAVARSPKAKSHGRAWSEPVDAVLHQYGYYF